jgi:hypothetical protein
VGVAGVQAIQHHFGDDLHKSSVLGDQVQGLACLLGYRGLIFCLTSRCYARTCLEEGRQSADFKFQRLASYFARAALLATSTPQVNNRIHQHFFTSARFIHTHKMANVDPTTHSAGVESDLSHKEKMSDDNPTAQRLEMESDASHKEKMGGTADLFDIPDPDAHLSEAERKAIVC